MYLFRTTRSASLLLVLLASLAFPKASLAELVLFPKARPSLSPSQPASLAKPDGPSPVIYPAQELPLKFSHARHLRRGATCTGCHEQAPTSVSARDNLLPPESACLPCHPIDRQHPEKREPGIATACDTCHVGMPVERVVMPAPFLKFNHRQHAEAAIDCTRCHGDLKEVDLATRAQLPKMALCLSCHREGLERRRVTEGSPQVKRLPTARCAACHLQQGNGTLEVRFSSGVLLPTGELRGDEHNSAFLREHRSVAQNDPAYCQNCHTESFCQRCHNSVVKPFDLHGGDYVHRHGLDARRNQPDCSSCHRLQTFCLGCHERLGVASHLTLPGAPSPSAFFPAAPRRFHPEGWASTGMGANLHATEAERNLRACVSCHREEACLGCHSSLPDARGPGGVNPHPADWVSSGRCLALSRRNSRMCLKCHRDGAAVLACPF